MLATDRLAAGGWLRSGSLGALPHELVDALSVDNPPAQNLGRLEFAHAEQSVYCRAREIRDMLRFVYRVSAPVGAIWFLKKLAHPDHFLSSAPQIAGRY
jgi:hypothetical protein